MQNIDNNKFGVIHIQKGQEKIMYKIPSFEVLHVDHSTTIQDWSPD